MRILLQLIIWRSLVQAQAGPHWKSATYEKSKVADFSFCEQFANKMKEAHPELAHQAAESHGHRTPITRQQPSESTHLRKQTITKEGSRDQNREWEVGHNTRYNDIDDENHLKR